MTRHDSSLIPNGQRLTTFVVPAMHCAGCIRKLENGLSELSHVDRARASLSMRQIEVVWRGDDTERDEIERKISDLGFDHHVAEAASTSDTETQRAGRYLLLCLAVAGFAAANIMLLSVSVWSGADTETEKLFGLISGLIAVPAVFFAGSPFFSSARRALSVGQLNMDVPISLAVLLSLLMSIYEVLIGGGEVFFDAGVMLLFFLLIGRTLDHFMREKAAAGVKNLARLMTRKATCISHDGSLATIALNEIVPGMRLRLLPGDRFPVDAKVVRGRSAVDRSIVTGEAAVIPVSAGDVLEAGTLNTTRMLDIEAVSDAQTSFLAEVMDMMKAAETGKGQYRRIADRTAAIYAPAVHLLAFVTFIGWLLATGETRISLVVAVAVLIITCPCALGLAVPVTHVVAASRLFKEGILMREGSALERLAEAATVFFDKTGTLTSDRLQLTEKPPLGENHAEILQALSSQSHHPAARVLSQHCPAVQTADVSDMSEVPGFGVEGLWDGHRVRLGRASWVGELQGVNIELPDTSTAFAIENGPVYLFQMSSELKPDGPQAVADLNRLGYPVALLSGDHRAGVDYVACQTGISERFFGLTPRDKIERITARQEAGSKVLMVGDGLNDAPSLAAAHVSMAPASATDVSRASANFVFTRPSLMAVPFALRISRAASRIVRQNFAIALAYNCIAVPLAIAGHVTPLIAAIAMSASSIVVVANSMRLALFDSSIGTVTSESPPETVQLRLRAALEGV